MRHFRGGGAAKRTAGGSQDDSRDAARGITRQVARRHALENCIMFAIDWNELGARMAHFIHEEPPGHDQRLLVGEKYALAGTHRRQGRLQPGGTHNGCHHHVHVGGADGTAQRPLAALDLGCRSTIAQGGARLGGSFLIDQHHEFGMKFLGLLHDDLPAAKGAQDRDSECFRVKRDDRERAAADASRRSQDGDTASHAHRSTPELKSPSAYKGAAAVTLSMRSNRPPCPGSSVPLSLSAAARLNMLSVRSPTMEKIPTPNPHAITAGVGKPK